MKILVFSDSHEKLDWMIAAVEKEKPDRVFFLGDHDRDGWDLSKLYPMMPINVVRGNCDWGPGQDELVLELDGVRCLLTHGHHYGVKTGYMRLLEAGFRCSADLVCFGHTHLPVDTEDSTPIRLFNPGTIGGLRGQRATYGVLQVSKGMISAQIKDTDTI